MLGGGTKTQQSSGHGSAKVAASVPVLIVMIRSSSSSRSEVRRHSQNRQRAAGNASGGYLWFGLRASVRRRVQRCDQSELSPRGPRI